MVENGFAFFNEWVKPCDVCSNERRKRKTHVIGENIIIIPSTKSFIFPFKSRSIINYRERR